MVMDHNHNGYGHYRQLPETPGDGYGKRTLIAAWGYSIGDGYGAEGKGIR